jgi:hypothetical protein
MLALSPVSVSAAVSEENFLLRNVDDLIALCDAAPGDPLHEQAIHICHGFFLGAVHFHDGVSPGPDPDQRLFCHSDPPPSRNDLIKAWIEWSRNNLADDVDLPVQSVVRFMNLTYPCGE